MAARGDLGGEAVAMREEGEVVAGELVPKAAVAEAEDGEVAGEAVGLLAFFRCFLCGECCDGSGE